MNRSSLQKKVSESILYFFIANKIYELHLTTSILEPFNLISAANHPLINQPGLIKYQFSYLSFVYMFPIKFNFVVVLFMCCTK